MLILTEGYIQNINKGSRDSYYMFLSQDEESGLFSTEELRVYFNDETLDSLMELKKGDYVTLLRTAQDWTDFVPPEYPDIVPENLDLLTFNSYGSVDYTKTAFILCVIQDDIRAYHLGLESAYDWNIDFSASDFNWDDYWMNLMDDLNNYLDGKQSKYKDAWKMGENAFYAFASGMPQSNEMISIANTINNIYLSLGDLR